MFSSTAEYALRAVVHLASHRGEMCGSRVIAAATRVPSRYLSKVLNDLVVAGIVVSQRGPHGGFVLAREPDGISVLDVVNAVDPIKRIETCPLGIPAHGKSLCRLHHKLDQTIAMVEQTLRAAAITDMTDVLKAGNTCQFPTVTAPKRGAAPGPGRK